MKDAPDRNLPWPILIEGVDMIADTEGLRLTAYQCQAGVWTIGWGETDGVSPGDKWTKKQADKLLCEGILERSEAVLVACKVAPGEHELAALTSFAYNYGGWKTSTVLRAHNTGDKLAAARAFGLVNKFTDPKTKQLVVSRGLTARRARESAMYLTPDGDVKRLSVQAVESESNLVKSPIGQAGVVTAVGGALTTAMQFSEPLKTVVQNVSEASVAVNINPALSVGLLILAVGLVVVYWRWKQRQQGWA